MAWRVIVFALGWHIPLPLLGDLFKRPLGVICPLIDLEQGWRIWNKRLTPIQLETCQPALSTLNYYITYLVAKEYTFKFSAAIIPPWQRLAPHLLLERKYQLSPQTVRSGLSLALNKWQVDQKSSLKLQVLKYSEKKWLLELSGCCPKNAIAW